MNSVRKTLYFTYTSRKLWLVIFEFDKIKYFSPIWYLFVLPTYVYDCVTSAPGQRHRGGLQ